MPNQNYVIIITDSKCFVLSEKEKVLFLLSLLTSLKKTIFQFLQKEDAIMPSQHKCNLCLQEFHLCLKKYNNSTVFT